jgi:hypothetical protein
MITEICGTTPDAITLRCKACVQTITLTRNHCIRPYTHTYLKHLSVPSERLDALLNARAARVVEADHCTHTHKSHTASVQPMRTNIPTQTWRAD